MKKRLLEATVIVGCAILLALFSPRTALAGAERDFVRVGWFLNERYQEYDADGNPYGYNYEYLMEIAKYTNWRYKFVNASLNRCLEMLKEGQLDIVGCMTNTDKRQRLYSFPEFDCGSSYITMYVRTDSPLKPYDFASFNGLRVGYRKSARNGNVFLQFAREKGFKCKLVMYDREPELLAAVARGDVDAGIGDSLYPGRSRRIIAVFSPSLLYFVTTKGNEKIVSGLNMAIGTILAKDDFYDKKLAAKYFGDGDFDIIGQLRRLPVALVLDFSAILLALLAALAWFCINKARALNTIRKLLYHDSLTGMFNKCGFEKRAEEILSHAGTRRYAVVALDIDDFRIYNELNGAAAGNELLKAVGAAASAKLFRDEAGARYAADNFVFLMRAENEKELTERILGLNRHFRETANAGTIAVSNGVYIITDSKVSIQSMYDRAVFALKIADKNRVDSVMFYDDSLYADQSEDAALLMESDDAFKNGEFMTYYQPKYGTSDECLVGAEALVRWKKSDGTLVSPARFIELFEKNGLITKLDFYIFDEVCRTLSAQIERGIKVVPVSVNFSRAHLFDPLFPDKALAIREKYDVPSGLLEIELTESAFTLEAGTLTDAVSKLHEYGFRVAIDDFGSGDSSLGTLKDIKADTLKMDMRFMEGFEKGGRVGTIVTSVLRMARWLALPVVVEGVETKEQADFIKSVGGDAIQGYYYSKPLPSCEWEALLLSPARAKCGSGDGVAFSTEEIDILMGGNRLVNLLLSSLCSGFGLYEYVDGKLGMLRASDGYHRIMGGGRERSYSNDVIQKVHEEDRSMYIQCIEEAISTGRPVNVEFRRYNDDGRLMHIEGVILGINKDTRAPIVCMTFQEITDADRSQRRTIHYKE